MKTVWENADAKKTKAIHKFAMDYMDFLGKSKTEREFVTNAVKEAEEAGFVNIRTLKKAPVAGDRLYAVNKGKNLCLFVVGEKDLEDGMNILGAHIDSPRLDLKQHPIYEKDGLVLLDTHYYGGIKKYQWVARPMALHGIVVKKDGTIVPIVIGEDPKDPVVGISDLLIHLASDQLQKSGAKVVEGEALNVLAGSIPDTKEKETPVKKYLLSLLKEKYDIEEEDFISAEIEVVPADQPREYGLDRSMILGYGHDDRVCAYTSFCAIRDVKKPKRTACCILVDKEEIGSVGATGMQSRWFEMIVADLLERMGKTKMTELNRCLENSKMLSSDVSAAVDPNYPEVNDAKNAAYFGQGIVFNKYTGARGKSGSNDASPEFIAEVRKAMELGKVQFQTSELGKVDQGGGGTIAYILGNMNMDVMDAGIAVQNMHAPSEVVSKADVYEGYLAYAAFLKHIG